MRVISHWMAIPLYSVFWICDLIYVPQLKWQFFAIRLTIIPISVFATWFAAKSKSFKSAQLVAALYALGLASGINLMIYLIGDPSTVYYAGLNLVAIGTLSFLPLTRVYYIFAASLIYVPYFLISASFIKTQEQIYGTLVNSFFISSSICMCFLIRFFHEKSRKREIQARIDLNSELTNRNAIIRSKTEEAIRMTALSSQFSPQVVESIRNGNLELSSGGQRAQICSIFIDIVNSTERVTQIDKDKVEKIISKFLDDTVRILLKYDITIDKFLGDGILGFCNAPLPRQDYVSRTVTAALEILAKIENDQDEYERNWHAHFQVRIGIAKGFVNVGFYGNKKYFRSYTAIGPAVNLASRLCHLAEPSAIYVDYDVYEHIKDVFSFKFIGKNKLKGFGETIIHVYSVTGANVKTDTKKVGLDECPKCGGLVSLENNEKGQFILVCRVCRTPIESTGEETPVKISKVA